MRETPEHLPEGFPGQRILVLPRPIVRQAMREQLPISLIPTDVGYFPSAARHYFERPFGCDQLILILCVRGTGWVELQGQQYGVQPGELVAILPNEPHQYGASQDHPWTIYWCHAAGLAAVRIGAMLRRDGPSPILEIDDQPRLVRLFEEITEELAQGYSIDHLIPAAALTLAHLLGVAMVCRRRTRPSSDAALGVQQVISYMRDRLDRQIKVAEVAGMLNLSVSHFCAVFKKSTGFPPLDYFIRMKVCRACELLDGTDLSVKQIAEKLGFNDALYFSRAFRKVHGTSPKEYRKTRKG